MTGISTRDQTANSINFIPTQEEIKIKHEADGAFMTIGTSQLWNSNPTIGSSICISQDDVRISGDMYAVGASSGHRHIATAIAIWTTSVP